MIKDKNGPLFDRFCVLALNRPTDELNHLLTMFIADHADQSDFIIRHAILFIKTAEAARKHPECMQSGN